ncbi:hypothetical protein, partial [Pseudomonas marginalis]
RSPQKSPLTTASPLTTRSRQPQAYGVFIEIEPTLISLVPAYHVTPRLPNPLIFQACRKPLQAPGCARFFWARGAQHPIYAAAENGLSPQP